MAQRAEQREESRARILTSAGRGFRSRGFDGLGVDGLAREAGVTSGAFYAHFASKAEAFREAVVTGMQDLRAGVERMRATRGADWRRAFIAFYLGERRKAELPESCALQSLTGEVARADAEARQAYERELQKVVTATADGLAARSSVERRADAIALLALLSGGVSLARAVNDPLLADEIADAVQAAALRLEKRAAAPKPTDAASPPPRPGRPARPA